MQPFCECRQELLKILFLQIGLIGQHHHDRLRPVWNTAEANLLGRGLTSLGLRVSKNGYACASKHRCNLVCVVAQDN